MVAWRDGVGKSKYRPTSVVLWVYTSSRSSLLVSPVCKEGQKIVYGISKGRTLKVTCEVEADPEDVTFFWVFNNTYHKKHISTFFLASKLRSVAHYKPKTNEDFGSLYCWARNIVGVQKEPCIFSVIPAGRPSMFQIYVFDKWPSVSELSIGVYF